MSQRPLKSRPLDIAYLIFFVLHIPIMLLVDLVPFYPRSLASSFLFSIRRFYVTTYNDRFFIDPPQWFMWYAALEGIYHLPLSVWIIPQIWKGKLSLCFVLLNFFQKEAEWQGGSGMTIRNMLA